MAANVVVDGTLVEGPLQSCDQQLPSGTTTIPFWLNAGSQPKAALVSTGAKVRNVNSPSAFVTLSGVGATDDVTQANTVFVRVAAGLWQVRLTFNNPAGGTIVSVLPLFGMLLFEPDAADNFYCVKIEVQGTGLVEYYASGLQ